MEYRETKDKSENKKWDIYSDYGALLGSVEFADMVGIFVFDPTGEWIIYPIQLREISTFCDLKKVEKDQKDNEIEYMNLWECPKCGGKTDTYRHLYATVWCTKCGFVLRKEGDKNIVHSGKE